MADETTPPPPPDSSAPPAAEAKKEAPRKVEATDASAHPWVESIRAGVPEAVLSAKEFVRQVTVTVAKEKIRDVARHLKEREDFRYCVDITGVDWKQRKPRFDVVYHFYSFRRMTAFASSAESKREKRCRRSQRCFSQRTGPSARPTTCSGSPSRGIRDCSAS